MQPRASNEASVLLSLSNLGRKHILMAWSEAEGPNFLKYWYLSFKFGLKLDNIAIMHEQSKWHEAQLRASNEASVLLLLSNLGRKHILMAQSEAEGPNFLNIDFCLSNSA